jgi:hypothetical protein
MIWDLLLTSKLNPHFYDMVVELKRMVTNNLRFGLFYLITLKMSLNILTYTLRQILLWDNVPTHEKL